MNDPSYKPLIKCLQRQLNWYYPDSQESVTSRLQKNGQPKNFLVCRYREAGKYALCVRRENDVAVVTIKELQEGMYQNSAQCRERYSIETSGQEMKFSSVRDILYCYTIDGNRLKEQLGRDIELGIPLLSQNNYSWYYGRIPQREAETKLLSAQRFCFLVRDYKLIGRYVLCVLVNSGLVKNYIISSENGQYSLTKNSRQFSDLGQLITHYQTNSFVDDEDIRIQLDKPVERKTTKPPIPMNRPTIRTKPNAAVAGGVATAGSTTGLAAIGTAAAVTSNAAGPAIGSAGSAAASGAATADAFAAVVFKTISEQPERQGIKMADISITLNIPPAPIGLSPKEEYQWLERQELQMGQISRSDGQRDENKSKNRYKNILPYNHSRVKLKDANQTIPGDDYINANYIQSDGRKYIACQGCLTGTIQAFWRMMWQDDVRIIVMVTDLTESGNAKCVQYWPRDKGLSGAAMFDANGYRLKVILDEERQQKDDYILRKISLVREDQTPGNPDSFQEVGRRSISHFQYKAWPDKKVPKEPASVLNFLQRIENQWIALRSVSPIVVHCSAGIGRTGTFIVLALIFKALKQSRYDDTTVLKTLLEIRQQRPKMVQTEAQYEFIYKVIDSYKRGNQTYENFMPREAYATGPIYQNFAKS